LQSRVFEGGFYSDDGDGAPEDGAENQ
jgi:hypothetical protein